MNSWMSDAWFQWVFCTRRGEEGDQLKDHVEYEFIVFTGPENSNHFSDLWTDPALMGFCLRMGLEIVCYSNLHGLTFPLVDWHERWFFFSPKIRIDSLQCVIWLWSSQLPNPWYIFSNQMNTLIGLFSFKMTTFNTSGSVDHLFIALRSYHGIAMLCWSNFRVEKITFFSIFPPLCSNLQPFKTTCSQLITTSLK